MSQETVGQWWDSNPGKDNKACYKYFEADTSEKQRYIRVAKKRHFDNKKKIKKQLKKQLKQGETPLNNMNTTKKSKLSSVKQSQKNVKQSVTNVPQSSTRPDLLPLPLVDPGFEKFCRWFAYPSYKGLLQWQLDSHNELWGSRVSMELVHRDAGKSIKYADEYEWAMQFEGYDVLLLGWTDRRKEVALYVYTFFKQYDLIDADKRTSPFHFRLKNGGKFDCYLVSGKETLGMHSMGRQERFDDLTQEEINDIKEILQESDGSFDDAQLEEFLKEREGSERKLWISIDDPIDITFLKERFREIDLEMRFDSDLYSINPYKWSFTGTRKFEGDIFDFWKKKFKKKLALFQSGPFKEDGSLLCPERFTHPSLPTYAEDLKKEKRDLQEIRDEIGEYAWASEWEQNPHPITGAVFNLTEESFIMVEKQPLNRFHDYSFIYVDRATTTNKMSDYTGVVIGIREKSSGTRIITHDLTDKIPLEHLLFELCIYCRDFRAAYPDVGMVMVIEKQGGGDDMEAMIRLRDEFERNGEKIRNFIRESCAIEMVHATGDKIQRIGDRLEAPIKNKRIVFMKYLMNSLLVKSINEFPYCAHFDPIDALAMGDIELMKRVVASGDYFEEVHRILLEHANDEPQIPLSEARYLDAMELYEPSRPKTERRRVVFFK